jgi:hypothetical protein
MSDVLELILEVISECFVEEVAAGIQGMFGGKPPSSGS